jgi:hypothetical protein
LGRLRLFQSHKYIDKTFFFYFLNVVSATFEKKKKQKFQIQPLVGYLAVRNKRQVSFVNYILFICLFFETASHYIAQVGPELTVFLPQPPEYWNLF